MPLKYFGRRNPLRSSLQSFSTLGIHLFPRSGLSVAKNQHTVDYQTELSVIGTLSRTLSIPSISGPTFQSCVYNVDSLFLELVGRESRGAIQSNIMLACGYLSRSILNNSSMERGRMSSFTMRGDIGCSYENLGYCRRVSMNSGVHGKDGKNMLYKCFWSDASRSWKSGTHTKPWISEFRTSCSAPYSSGAASDVSFDGVPMDEQLANTMVASDEKSPGDRPLKLLSGSCYLPHPDKEKTGGEDAHFICVDNQAIGVADGVGGWADLGIDSGEYARNLMSNSVSAIKEEPKGSIDPARVLEKAYSMTKEKGSSTACIIALTDQGVHAVNIGDSGFIVVREGSIIFRSPVQQHDFNMPYQLDSSRFGDLPSAAQVFTFPVSPGDVIIAGTDGLFDNLYTNEVAAVVVNATRAKLGPEVAAQKIAALARERALDAKRHTPFSTAAQHAGYRFYGGKLDDISVVVSYITAVSTA